MIDRPSVSGDTDPIARALEATHQRLRRSAQWRLGLYAWFAVMTLAAGVFVASIASEMGIRAVVSAWPALLTQVGAACVLAWLLRSQAQRVASLRARAKSVIESARAQWHDTERSRRQSLALLTVAASSFPLLLIAIERLRGTGALGRGDAGFLVLLCAIPALVIAGVHGTRLAALRRERERLAAILRVAD